MFKRLNATPAVGRRGFANDHDSVYPEQFAAEALYQFEKYIVLPRVAATDYKDEVQEQGDLVKVQVYNEFTANSMTVGGDVTIQDAKSRAEQVPLDNHEEVTFFITSSEASWSFTNLVKKHLIPAIRALGDKVDQDGFASITGASPAVSNIGTVAAGSLYDKTDMKAARKWMNSMSIPMEDRFALLGVESEANALDSAESLLGNDKVGEDGSRLKNASLGKLYSINWLLASNVPTVTAGSPDYERNVVFHKDAIQFVSRPLEFVPADKGVNCQIVANDYVAMRIIQGYNMTKLATQVTVDILYGWKPINYAYPASPSKYYCATHNMAIE